MFDNILSSLTQQALPKLTQEHGLSPDQAKSSISAAASGLQGVLSGNHGFDMGTLTNLFSKETNTPGANGLMEKIGQSVLSNLTGKAGLSADKAGAVKNTLMPMIMDLVTKQVGGNADSLKGLLGGLSGGGVADKAKGLLGKLFK